jgi:transcriptional/translational regulatory protein YebC/TACO1
METDNKSRARHDIKSIIKKQKGYVTYTNLHTNFYHFILFDFRWQLARDNTVIHSFNEKGVIRLEKYDRDGQPINYEQIEEIAIEAEAEEVIVNDEDEKTQILSPRVESSDSTENINLEETDEDEQPCWTLRTDPMDLFKVKGYIEKSYPKLVLRDYMNEYIPIQKIDLPEEQLEDFNKMYTILEEHEEIDNIYVNVA